MRNIYDIVAAMKIIFYSIQFLLIKYFNFKNISYIKMPKLYGPIHIRGQNGLIKFCGNVRTRFLGRTRFIFDDPEERGEVTFGSGVIIEDDVLLSARSGKISIGTESFIGPSVILQSYKDADILIGNHVLIAAKTVVFSTNHTIDEPSKGYFGENGKTVNINDHVWIGANCVVTAGISIGKCSIIGAGSIVTKDIPPYSMAVGNPAKIIKQYDSILQTWIKK
jgi:acetyltransferase-like isoleucine patch superfamily enzyme